LAYRALDQAFVVTALPGLSQVSQLIDAPRYPDQVFESFKPRYPQRLLDFGNDCFAAISNKDLLVHWPYESFDVLIRFLEQAATDPQVLSIKQTLYRTSDNSPIVNAMVDAASRGKTVTAVIELEARDNEQANVALAKRLEDAGVQIVYGIIGLKIHCKLTIVTRREDDEVVIYSHFGTGNYHPGNARTYTDLSFFTRDTELGTDANKVFNYITSEHFVAPGKIAAAPKQLRRSIFDHIDAEIAHASAGRPAAIWAKVNSLTDPTLIDRLYAASEAGVQIELVIRRHCSLVPGVAGMSSNISVKSIVGRFLEHARIYCFANGSNMASETAAIYLASADWMERNLDERVEVMVPMTDATVRAQVLDQIMRANIKDNKQSWYLQSDGEYLRSPGTGDFCAQSYFMQTPNLSGLGSSRSLMTIQEPCNG
jgi:polyphosphate kinase